MGIRFQCPNGHSLNVKSFLAGKHGLCPKCGIRVLIPLESQASASSGGASKEEPVEGVGPEVAPAGLPQNTPEALPQIQTAATQAAKGQKRANTQKPATPVDPSSNLAESAPAPPSLPPTSAAQATDVLSEAPEALWYVAPQGGGQFGPASGDAMRGWLAEGRIDRDSLVWRQDWPEWRPAADVFPQFQSSQPVPASSPEAAVAKSAPVGPASIDPVSVEPLANEPAPVSPVSVEPVAVEPVAVEPVAIEPIKEAKAGKPEVIQVGPHVEPKSVEAPTLSPSDPAAKTASQAILERRRKRSDFTTILWIVGLVFVAIILAIACVFVIMQ